MKKRGLLAFSLVVGISLTLAGAFFSSGADEYLTVRVKKGDTISYLSFKTYGLYDSRIGELLLRENPQIKDINRIFPGQELRFPSPEGGKKAMGDKVVGPVVPKDRKEKVEIPAPAEPMQKAQIRTNKGVITFLAGQVQVKRSFEPSWIQAEPNMILSEKDEVKVGADSRAELILDNQTVLRLSENTLLSIEKLEEELQTQRENTKMGLRRGTLWTKVGNLFHRSSRYDVSTPAAIAGVQGTTYQIMVASDQKTQVQVFQGVVNVYNPFPKTQPQVPEKGEPGAKPKEVRGPVEVRGPAPVSQAEWTQIVLLQFQQITITQGDLPQATPLDMTKMRETEWVRWNEERDEDFKPPDRLRQP